MDSGMVSCDVNDFYDNVMAMFGAMVEEAEDDLRADVYAAADSAAEELRHATGPWSQTGSDPSGGDREPLTYEKGWKAYKHAPQDGHVEAVVANATAPGLTHLIEKGHELFVYGVDTGRRTQARPHIREAYEHAAQEHFGRW